MPSTNPFDLAPDDPAFIDFMAGCPNSWQGDAGFFNWCKALYDQGAASAGAAAPVIVTEPFVGATSLSVGGVANSTMGTWTNEPTEYAYQWLRNGSPIPAGTSPDYVLGIDDIGTMLSCEVSASNSAGSASAFSNSIGPITA
jgi:hypothetical protein